MTAIDGVFCVLIVTLDWSEIMGAVITLQSPDTVVGDMRTK